MVIILNDPLKVKEIDKSNMLTDLDKTPEYCRDAINRAKQTLVPERVNPKNIVVIGMGGSAIGGEILQDWLRNTLPIHIEVCRDYVLPLYVDKDTLVFVNSYSGNTEETLSGFFEAIKRKCTIYAISSGGLLIDFCKKLKIQSVLIPEGLQPRAAIPYLFFPLPILMQKMGILSNVEAELEEVIKIIEETSKINSLGYPLNRNKAKKIAQNLQGKIPVVYGFRQYISIAHRLKAQFNENSKLPSKSASFPELNHNEIVGYEGPEYLNKQHSIILIRDPEEPIEIRNRIETTKNFVFKKANSISEISAKGKSKLTKMFSVMCIGDYVSVYLAILHNKDPSPVKMIDKIKKELVKRVDMKTKYKTELSKLL